MDISTKNLDHIHRTADGRFVLAEDTDDVDGHLIDTMRSNSIGESDISGSDDGGFLPKRGGRGRTSWRRPLVSCPSQLSFRSESISDAPSRHLYKNLEGLFGIGRRQHHQPQTQRLLRTVPIQYHSRPIDEHLHINTISANIPSGPMVQTPYTPSKVSRIVSSSPATSSPLGVTSPWSPQSPHHHTMYFSDLSSVQQPSSAERSLPTTQTSGISQLRYLQERYSQELPSLRAIHEETRRMAQGFVPLQIQLHSPSWRYSQPPSQQHTGHPYPYRQRARLLPRYARMARSAPELGSPGSNFNAAMHISEASPESRSSSSGFGSKNTSTQQNQSSQSGSTTHDWRYLPPYKPPPPPPSTNFQQYYPYQHPVVTDGGADPSYYAGQTMQQQDPLPYSMGQWLEIISQLNAASETVSIRKAVDVGSVDGHYEFDPATPTPTASTPTGPRDDSTVTDHHLFGVGQQLSHHYGYQHATPMQRKRWSKYDNIEARVQAMKEEFYEYRKRQAMRRAGVELESAC